MGKSHRRARNTEVGSARAALRKGPGAVRLAARPFSPTLQAGAAVRSQEWGRVRTPEMPQLPWTRRFGPTPE